MTTNQIAHVIAERYVLDKFPSAQDALAREIENAIRAEREQCAQIADKQAGKGRTVGDTKAIATAIRGRR
jgi:hypothetical protein